MSALRFYLKLQSNNKKTYLILFFLYLAINSLFISNPSFDFTKYAFEYQEDDYIGNIPTISNETFFELNDLIYAIKEVSDKLGYFTASNYTKITLLYHNATLFTDLMVLLEFYDGNEIKLQIDPLYYRSNGNNTIYFTDFNLSNINIIESALNYTNSNIHGTILLPNDYFNSSNISIYFGINLNQELFNQGEIEQIIDKVDAEFDWWIDNIEEIWEIDIIYENLISTTIIQLQENQSLLTFNSFFLVIIFIGGLTIFLFYCQLLIYNRDLASYYTGYLRGFNPKMIYRLFPLYFILSQAIIGIMSILTSKLILQGSFEFNLNQFLPVLIGIITAVYAVISSLDKFKRFEPQDATDITINTNVMEQFFLLMTILVALVNITLNSDLIKYEDLILVMFIYLFFGLIFSYILAKIVLISGKKINDFIKNQNITISSTNLYYYVNNIVINHKSRKFKLSMLIGFVVISLTIHGYISYNIMKNPNYDNYAGDFSGSYSNFSEISTLQHNPNEFTMSLQIPANLISFGIQLEGFITTDTNLMQLEENIINIDDDVEFPSLWLRSDSMELFDDLNFRDNNLINIVLFGSQELEIPHNPKNSFVSSFIFPTNSEFILFLDPIAIFNYTNSLFFTIKSNTIDNPNNQIIRDMQEQLELVLSDIIIWLKQPDLSVFQYTLIRRAEEIYLLGPELTIYLIIIVLAMLGLSNSSIFLGEDLQILLIRGGKRTSILKYSLYSFPINLFIMAFINIISLYSSVYLISYFSIINIVNLSYSMQNIVLFGLISILIWLIADVFGWYYKLRNIDPGTTKVLQRIVEYDRLSFDDL